MASVGNIMANKGLTELAAAIVPASASKGNTEFGEYIQQTMDQQKPVEAVSGAVKTDSAVKEQPVSLRQDGSGSISDSGQMQTGGAQEQVTVTEDQMVTVNQAVQNAVKTALGVDEETMETILAEMGIMPVELLQPENLQQFILLLDGGQNVTDFLMNEEMMGDFNLASQVLQALDLTEVTDVPMAEILQQMEILTEEIPVDMAAMSDSISADLLSQGSELPLSQETAEEAVEEPELIVLPKENLDKAVNQSVSEETQASSEESVTIPVQVSNSAAQNGNSQNMGESSEWQESGLSEQVTSARPEPEPEFIAVGNHFQQQMTANSVSEIVAPQPTPQMVQIVEQIVEQIRIHAQADTTTMEMQLNPESLGKVLLTISTRAGMMTANFTVQTEEARMAVESQMYTLRENLEQKELKVDAVEVTVSNFEFTQSGNGEDQKDLNQGDGRSRRFHMEEQEEDGEEISQEAEAERVRRNVMRDNGGSVDFIA